DTKPSLPTLAGPLAATLAGPLADGGRRVSAAPRVGEPRGPRDLRAAASVAARRSAPRCREVARPVEPLLPRTGCAHSGRSRSCGRALGGEADRASVLHSRRPV